MKHHGSVLWSHRCNSLESGDHREQTKQLAFYWTKIIDIGLHVNILVIFSMFRNDDFLKKASGTSEA